MNNQPQMAIKTMRGRGVRTYLLIKPYPFLTLNHLTVPKTFVAAMRQSAQNFIEFVSVDWLFTKTYRCPEPSAQCSIYR